MDDLTPLVSRRLDGRVIVDDDGLYAYKPFVPPAGVVLIDGQLYEQQWRCDEDGNCNVHVPQRAARW